ncbi:hypothetical protein [Streptomyces sp. GB4-14]
MKAHSALSGPTAAFALAGLWAMPVRLVIGVQRLRAGRAADDGPAPPA